MNRRVLVLAVAPLVLALAAAADLAVGRGGVTLAEVAGALLRGTADTYGEAVVLYQRLPRVLIAVYVGAVMAVAGTVLQGLVRNPLASPATLGLNAGATASVVGGALLFDLGPAAQGVAALAGAVAGFLGCLGVARLAGRTRDPRGLSLILAGALVSMLLVGVTNAFLLSDPVRRGEFLGWVTGNVNHVYIDRLAAFWWLGAIGLAVLGVLARPLTLVLLGAEKAASAGVDVRRVSRLALAATMLATGSAVAVCGPVGFVGLIVPHMVRPLVGANLAFAMPAAAMTGAAVCLLADLAAREAFHPYVLHTGLLLDLIGGVAFVAIVRRVYLAPGAAAGNAA